MYFEKYLNNFLNFLNTYLIVFKKIYIYEIFLVIICNIHRNLAQNFLLLLLSFQKFGHIG